MIQADLRAPGFWAAHCQRTIHPEVNPNPGVGERPAGADFARGGGSPRWGVSDRGGGCCTKGGGEPRKGVASGAMCQSPGGAAAGAAVGAGGLCLGATAGGGISLL